MSTEYIKKLLDEFIKELDDPIMDEKIQCIRKISQIAKEIGHEETVSSLIPFLERHLRIIYQGEELYPLYAEELVKLSPSIFEIDNTEILYNLFEILADVGDTHVRETVVDSLIEISKKLKENGFEIFVKIIFKLMKHINYACRCTGLNLSATIYPRISQPQKTELFDLFMTYSKDSSPPVRKEALIHLNKFAVVLEKQFLGDVAHYLKQAMVDEDAIRLQCVDLAITVANMYDEWEATEKIVPIIDFLSKDTSWKIRKKLASDINPFQIVLGLKTTHEHLLPIVHRLSEDDEEPVREEIAHNIVRFAFHLQTQNESDELDPHIEKDILSIVRHLNDDLSSVVSSALSTHLLEMVQVWGPSGNKKYILPLIIQRIRDTKIKQLDATHIFNINRIIKLMKFEDIAGILERTMFELQTTPSTNWRARRNLAETIVKVMQCNVDTYFKSNTLPFFFKLLQDEVYAVRRSATTIIPIFTKHYGMEWCKNNVLNKALAYSKHPDYRYRMIVFFCIEELVRPTLQNKTPHYLQIFTEEQLYETLILVSLIKITMECTLNEELGTSRETSVLYEQDFYMEDMLDHLKYETDCNFVNDPFYLKSLLKFILIFAIKELKELASDQIYNIRNRSIKTLNQIMDLQINLNRELREKQSLEKIESLRNKKEITAKLCTDICQDKFIKDETNFVVKGQKFEKGRSENVKKIVEKILVEEIKDEPMQMDEGELKYVDDGEEGGDIIDNWFVDYDSFENAELSNEIVQDIVICHTDELDNPNDNIAWFDVNDSINV